MKNMKVVVAGIGGFILGLGVMFGAQNINFGPKAIYILTDKRCTTCDVSGISEKIKKDLPKLELKTVDYSESLGKRLFKDAKLTHLPAAIFTASAQKDPDYSKVQRYAQKVGDYAVIPLGKDFDPTAEICDNKLDDNQNGAIDCSDASCKSNWLCMEKKEVPVVEAFVMSHCPYGTQFEKGFVKVWDVLGKKADFEVKFCDYAMHGKKEIDEQLLQYCIQEDSKAKFLTT